jgi:hypothetical protein
VVYTNDFATPKCPGINCGSPGIVVPYGQRLMNTNQLEFAQTSKNVTVPWKGTASATVVAVVAGTAGNVGSGTITVIEGNPYDQLTVTNPQATGGGTDPSSTPQMTEADFDAGRAQLEQELRQSIAQTLVGSAQTGEKLSETIVYSPPQYTTDHQPNDKVPTFSGTMTISGEGDYYTDADVQKAFQTYLSQRVPNDQQLLTESPIQVTYRVLTTTQGGNITFVGDASAYVAPRLDEAKIRAQIVGRPLAQARFYLERLPIRSVAIKEQPLALPLMPLLVGRITLHYVVQQGVPASSAAPPATSTPSPTSP